MLSIWLTIACNTPEPIEVPPLPQTAVAPKTKAVAPESQSAGLTKTQSTSAEKEPPVVTGDKPFFSELMLSPSKVARFRGEWIELSNPTDTVIDLSTYSIHSEGDSGIYFTTEHKIEAQSTFLMAVRKSPTGNGGLPPIDRLYNWGVLKILGTDWIELRNGDEVVDRWEITRKERKQGHSVQRNFDGKTCYATQSYGDGDFGSPKIIELCP